MSKAAMMWTTAVCLTAAVAIAQDDQPGAGNWANWRGPHYNGVAPQGNPPIEWSEQENLRWKVALPGQGSGSPVIWGDKLFLLTAIPAGEPAAKHSTPAGTEPVSRLDESRRSSHSLDGGDQSAQQAVALLQSDRSGRERRRGDRPRRSRRGGFGGGPAPTTPYEFVVLCLDRNTGETLWRQTARKEVPHEAGHETNSLASASAVTDGKLLYASFGSRGIYCYDLDGKKVWETDLGEMETRGAFGEGATPALHGDTLIVPWDHEGPSFVVALDAKTGDEKWRVDRDEPTTWATPLVVPRGDGFQVVLNGTNRVRSYDLENGELLWECGGQAMNPIPTPVADDERVYVMTGFRGFALYAIPLDAEGDLTDTDRIAWKRNDGTPYISSPVLSNGLLYITKDRNAILSCLEAATGKEHYTNKRLPGLGTLYSSPIAVAGRLYYFDRSGAAIVLKDGPEFEILAENQLDETVDASPAVIGDVMYVRGEKSLYAIAEE